MKPKLNILKKEVQCNEPVFADLPSILMCSLSYDTEVFDATEFCKKEELEEIDYATFYSHCMRSINAKIADDGVKQKDLFYQNTDGHLLVNMSIVLIYIQYAMPSIVSYFNNLIMSCLANGMAFSDSFAMRLAMSQLPDEALQNIIKARQQEDESE